MSSNRERAQLDANKKRKSKRKDYGSSDEVSRHYERKIRKSLEKDKFDKYRKYDEEGF
jgi:hypothetical protein